MSIKHSILKARLKNCLATIVELEPALIRLNLHHELVREFTHLKDIISRISEMEVTSMEVDRIENATELFLRELDIPLSGMGKPGDRQLQ
ncbi:MAG: hypothetical protein ACOCV7_05020 [Desulfonatronovibrionaceae bacterium]